MTIYTVGHSTRSIEEFTTLLQGYGIELVADIRTIPRSRHNPQFNREDLERTMAAAGIGYRHLKGLGGLRHPRAGSPNTGWRNASFRGFADYMLTEDYRQALEELIGFAAKTSVVLMCAEAVPWRCHRSLIGDSLTIRGMEVVDIISKDSLRKHSLSPMARVAGTEIVYPAGEGE